MILRDIAGYRKREGEGWDYFITTSAWRDEICRGFDSRMLAAQLANRSMLLPSTGAHRAKLASLPGYSRCRLYHIPASFLEGDDND